MVNQSSSSLLTATKDKAKVFTRWRVLRDNLRLLDADGSSNEAADAWRQKRADLGEFLEERCHFKHPGMPNSKTQLKLIVDAQALKALVFYPITSILTVHLWLARIDL